MFESEMIPESVRRLFWDVKKESVNVENHSFFIIRRVLDYGDTSALAWLRKTYPDELIKEIVRNKRGLEHKTLVFWKRYYNLNSEK